MKSPAQGSNVHMYSKRACFELAAQVLHVSIMLAILARVVVVVGVVQVVGVACHRGVFVPLHLT